MTLIRSVTTLDAEARAVLAAADVTLRMDEEAFRAFYGRTARILWAYLARVTGDPHAADDLLQESYYRLLRSNVPLDGDVHRRRYLFRIATNLAHDRFRRQQREPEISTAESSDAIAAAGDSAGDLNRRLDLTRAFGRLRPRERALLWLAYAQGANHHEIADVMRVRHGSVKVLLGRARRRLARLLCGSGRPR